MKTKISNLIKDIAAHPGTYIQILIMIVLVLAALRVVIATNGGIFFSQMWHEFYCNNNPLICIQKGW